MSEARPAGPLKRAGRWMGRLSRGVERGQVSEATALARALTAMAGRDLMANPSETHPTRGTRALLTDRVLRGREPVPWPAAVMRQLDPDDGAFLPPLGLHPVLAGRDCTRLGLPGEPRTLWVDPYGWCAREGLPGVSVWFGDAEHAWPVGRRPGEPSGGRPLPVRQEWSDERVGLRTVCTRGPLTLTLMHFSVRLEGELAWALYSKLLYTGEGACSARLAVVVRPAGLEGTTPIFTLSREREGLWLADGRPVLAVAQPGTQVLAGRGTDPDPWTRFSQAAFGGLTQAGRVDLRCPVGQASGGEVWDTTLEPGQELTRLVVVAPPKRSSAALVRTSGHSLWGGATADARGLLRAGSEIELGAHQLVFEVARKRLLVAPTRLDFASLMATVALARMGFVRRAEDRLGSWLDGVRRDGRHPAGGGAVEAVLAWAAGEVVRWTGNRAWAREQRSGWTRLLRRLASEPVDEPGGEAIFGREGSAVWTHIWRAAGLLSSASALREHAAEHTDWAIAGGEAREALPAQLGAGPWSVAPERTADGAAAALMAAPWLGVLPKAHPGVAATLATLRRFHWHGGGVLLQGGAHVAATALLLAVEQRLDPTVDPVAAVAALASPTGALPTARHPARGALGSGHDLLSAALFSLVTLDRVQVERGRLVVYPGLVRVRDLPTPFGRLDLTASSSGLDVVGRWRGPAPEVVVMPVVATPPAGS